MACPHCRREGKESMIFPANNLGFGPALTGYLDPSGVYIQPQPVPLYYGCTQGHQFSINEIADKVDESSITI